MNIKTYDAILNTVPTGNVCRGDIDGFELVCELRHTLWWIVFHISHKARLAGEKWLSEEYYNEVMADIYWRAQESAYMDDEEILQADIDTLKESLDDLSPVGYYFGGHQDDPWRLGVWEEWRNAE